MTTPSSPYQKHKISLQERIKELKTKQVRKTLLFIDRFPVHQVMEALSLTEKKSWNLAFCLVSAVAEFALLVK